MRFFNWAESFKENPTCEDILKKIHTIEILYWVFLLLSVIIAVWGVFIMILAPAGNLKAHVLGLFLAIDGSVQVTLIKIWAHIKLSMYRIIWDSKNRTELEIKKSELQDM
jgi:hypothetical protein